MANGPEFQPQFDQTPGTEFDRPVGTEFYRTRGVLDQFNSTVNKQQGSNFDTFSHSEFSQPSVETINNPGGMVNHQVEGE